ncbi:uncharacterized protein B0I36DRAFT_72492 [Microdochium trichocladiopsis]|uniref:CCHC-type domain-containing protein n=1 Tax=Microdochium trichocladiopsis TaxID=1682393 RepID=A0A9P9BYB3_9PEZI|nr:uncharacterized protein B0I36DRAFT_72492 [Microdochium trichocladiopsis]KAH7037888.1 hypothetical protein B0I36DRAFT_72492 [Microdochium trichocladiopsis]
MATQTPPKTMSSRLLTMKFMQRAATTPTTSSPSTPASEEQSAKRRKVAHKPEDDSIEAMVDHKAVQLALAEEERKRHEAVLRNAAAAGDARWVLNAPQHQSLAVKPLLNVVQVGFAQIDSPNTKAGNDSDDSASESETAVPFRRFNMEKKKIKKPITSDSESDSDSDSESDSDSDSDDSGDEPAGRTSYGQSSRDSSDPDRAAAARRAVKAMQGTRTAEQSRAAQLAGKRRKKDVKLNSISSGGGGGLSRSGSTKRPQTSSVKCYKCGKPGHKATECSK